ncbi:MAG: YbdD/YjiX family protein [Mobilicoccus sp.]|nr:YbdD/YjiX family protein [Mobilicoccus sp.]
MSEVVSTARRVFGTLRWYMRGITGADAYDRYVAHLQRTHPGCAVPTERDFWRAKFDDMERNPKSRCC